MTTLLASLRLDSAWIRHLLNARHEFLLRLSIDKLDCVRDLVIALIEVEHQKALHIPEFIFLLDKERGLALLNVLDHLEDLPLQST